MSLAIPKVRAEMRPLIDMVDKIGKELAAEGNPRGNVLINVAARQAYLNNETKRRPMQKARAAPSARPITAQLRGKIRAYAAANPRKSQLEIANLFDVNPGRVSEALAAPYDGPDDDNLFG